jgi:hypothetical protein
MIFKKLGKFNPALRQMPGISGFADRVKKEKVPSMMKGGMVKKTGLHMLHKGEMVIPAKMSKKIKDMK